MPPTKSQIDRWKQFRAMAVNGITMPVDIISEAEAKDALCDAMDLLEELECKLYGFKAMTLGALSSINEWKK